MAPNPSPNPNPKKVIDISSGDESERRPDPAGFDSLLGFLRPNKARKKKKRRKKRRSWHPFFRPAEAFSVQAAVESTNQMPLHVDVSCAKNVDSHFKLERVDSSKGEEHAESCSKAMEERHVRQGVDGSESAILTDLLMPALEEDQKIAVLNSTKCVGEMASEVAVVVIDLEEETGYAAEDGGQSHAVKGVEVMQISETQSNQLQEPIAATVEPGKHADRNEDMEPVALAEHSSNASKEIVDTIKPGKHTEGSKEVAIEVKSLDMQTNVVLKKLIQGPRYFDLPKGFWDECDHGTQDYVEEQQRRPCFICGSFEHMAKHCILGFVGGLSYRVCDMGLNCFSCQKRGHLAKDCPEKNESNHATSKFCLRCGELGHDMTFCTVNYSSEDLKKIQCYVCYSFGHLCCANFPETGPGRVTCYNCGQPGHAGMVCGLKHRDSGRRRTSKCNLCGEKGHFAVRCPNASMRIDKHKGFLLGSQSVPQSSIKFHPWTPVELNRRAWTMVRYRANQWISPAATSSKGN